MSNQTVKLTLRDEVLRKFDHKGYKAVSRWLRECQNKINNDIDKAYTEFFRTGSFQVLSK